MSETPTMGSKRLDIRVSESAEVYDDPSRPYFDIVRSVAGVPTRLVPRYGQRVKVFTTWRDERGNKWGSWEWRIL